MADSAPDNLTVSLDEAIRAPSLKHQRELYPWKKEYENLNYDSDKIDKTEIAERGKGPHTLSAVLLPGLEKTNDKRLAWRKFKAICARLVLAHFNPDKVKVGYIVRLENNVLYIERPKAKRAKNLGLRLKRDAHVDSGYEELQPEREKLIEKSQREWNNLADAINKRIVWDVIVALYGKKYAEAKLNKAKRKQIWTEEMQEAEKFTGTAVQNGKILDFLKKKVENLKAGEASSIEPVAPIAPAPIDEELLPEGEPAPLSPADQARIESARKAALDRRNATFTPPVKPDEIANAHVAYLVEEYGKAGGKLKKIYDALSPEDQANIEEDPRWKGVIVIKNGQRYLIEPADDTVTKVHIKIESEGSFIALENGTIDINTLKDFLAERAAKLEKGTETPLRPEVYPTAEEVFGRNLIRPNRTSGGLLENVFHKIELNDAQQVITGGDGKQYKLDLRNGVKDVYRGLPYTVERHITCYPADDFGNFEKQDTLVINFRRSDKSFISAHLYSKPGQVSLPKDHPLLKLELVR